MKVEGSAGLTSPKQASQVKLFNKQGKQLETVVGKLLEGIEAQPAPRSAAQPTGQVVNIKA